MPPAASIFTHVIMCCVKICETNLLGLRPIRASLGLRYITFRKNAPAASIFTHVIMCSVKICETNLLGLRLIRADARPVDLDFRDESLFECAAKPISLIIIYRYTKRSTEPTVFRNAEICAETGAYYRNRGDSCRPCVREGGARGVTEGLLV